MDNIITKKGVSQEAKALSEKLRDRFVEFVKNKGLSEVSRRTGCNYQALRNSVVDNYNPSLDTVFQVKLGYGDEFDEVYIFTGLKINPKVESTVSERENQVVEFPERLATLKEKLKEREEQIQELKNDKLFLQGLINKQ